MSRNWWILALRGVLAIIFGILAFIWPTITIGALAILFGAYVLVDGVFSVAAGISSRSETDRWWVALLEGLAGIIVGVLALIWPSVTALVLIYFIAAWALFTGIMEIVGAIRLRQQITNEWALALSGVLSIILGIAMFFAPGISAVALVWVVGAYAILFGALMIYLAFQVRGGDETSYDAPGQPA
jgi:uncharacterized membrane protein HdeD (DUF308 family)